MLKRTLTITSALALAGGVASAQGYDWQPGAEEPGFYVGGGYSFVDIETDEDDIGDNTNALFLRGGYQATSYFGVEADAIFGIDDGEFDYDGDEDDFDFDDNNDGDLNDVLTAEGDIGLDYLIGIYARGVYPVTDAIDLSARAGYAFAEIDATLETLGGEEFSVGGSEDGFSYGVGAAYDVSETQSIRVDYVRYEFDEANADGGQVSYEVKF